MQIPYRRFAKYFYLRESIKETYKAYVKEQKELGLRVLSESAMYKILPQNVCSQKNIPFMECLCVKCLNLSHLIDVLRVAHTVMEKRAILNVMASICPILINRNELDKPLEEIEADSSQNDKLMKDPVIHFCNIEQVQLDDKSFKFRKKANSTISNDVKEESKKHHPNKFLLGSQNAPQNLLVKTVVLNCKQACMFRECNKCGFHKLFQKTHEDNENPALEYSKGMIWCKWCSFVEKFNG